MFRGVLLSCERPVITIRCDLCGGCEQDLVFVKEGFRHVRCRTCGMVFVNPRLAEHLEAQKNCGTGAMGDDTLTGPQIRRLRRELAEINGFRKLNRILEVGAGKGWFLSEAAQSGWETWAVEINSSAIRDLKSKGLYKIISEPAEDFEVPNDYFDVARTWDVIEHLRSPHRSVANIWRALRPGGILRLSTTNFASLSRWVNGPEWVYLNGADHIFLFEPETITRLLAQQGFENIIIRTRSFNLRRKLYHPEQDLPTRLHILTPFRKLIDEAIRFTRYGHQMIVTAVKVERALKTSIKKHIMMNCKTPVQRPPAISKK